MYRQQRKRVSALEDSKFRRHGALLPAAVVLPDTGRERFAMFAEIERRRSRGERIITVENGGDILGALVDEVAP